MLNNKGVNMVRKKRDSGKDSFELTPEKANKLHDDRSYCMALCAWWLSEKRLEDVRTKRHNIGNTEDILAKLIVSSGKHVDKIFG